MTVLLFIFTKDLQLEGKKWRLKIVSFCGRKKGKITGKAETKNWKEYFKWLLLLLQ